MSKNKGNLLILASTYPRWIADSEPGFVHELARRLTPSFNVTVVCPHSPGAEMLENLDGVSIRRFRYAMSSMETLVHGGGMVANIFRSPWKFMLLPSFFFAYLFAVDRILSRNKIDVIHAHWIIPQGLILLMLRLLGRKVPPILLTSHGGDLFGLQGSFFSVVKEKILRQADQVTVVSYAMVEPARRLGVSMGKLEVIPMGVDFDDRFTPGKPSERKKARLLFVGRLVEKKGISVLLEAMPEIISAFPDVRLKIVGDGPLRQQLVNQCNRLGISAYVSFVGARAQLELPVFYREASLFVAPFVRATNGDQEGLGLVSVEAIACECPVVLGAVPAVLDVLDECLDAESLIEPGDVSGLVDAIVSALTNYEATCRKAALLRNRLLVSFSWNTVALRYSGKLEALAQRRSI